jgi:hypothetical protein
MGCANYKIPAPDPIALDRQLLFSTPSRPAAQSVGMADLAAMRRCKASLN